MKAFIIIGCYLVFFFIAYLCMLWRQKACGIKYDATDFNPTLFAALFVPPLAIVFAFAEITAHKLHIKGEGEYAI